ncbi:SOS response-associated peptidase [Oscillatoria sp. FACHB-1407]|uniref:SOS response-associated peptidase n=1 Tax=Oscillatoria sp. FACHB-1407 TaxID=2692847 RepID=UPI0016872E8F|nr:SOS response-associated peptidase family protein [Oscillatoria sp. FACHB-1407]MBD2462653.1 SOS response-associated peptidase [Oscillatoria sp. FACHB-1407]
MCGRFSLGQTGKAIAETFQLSVEPDVMPRYNIAPTQPAPVVLAMADEPRHFQLLYWGLIPSWAKDPKMGARLINARAETVAEKPSFRAAFKRRRCLVVTDGFYEWQRSDTGKQPYYFQMRSHQPFAFAGLWEHWQGADGSEIDSCTILTTEANDLLSSIHDRMPVILHPQDYDLWLDPDMQQTDRLEALLQPYDTDPMMSYPVSPRMNSPKYDDPTCVEPIGA